jgi:PleD family two-component response regulator
MKLTVLIVGSLLARTCSIGKDLAGLGARTLLATNPYDALLTCCTSAPDLVVVDGAFAEFDAVSLCRTVKADESLAALPVMLLAGRGDSLRAFDAGADDVVEDGSPSDLASRAERLMLLARLRVNLDFPRFAADTARLRVLLIDPDRTSRDRLLSVLSPDFAVSALAAAEGRSGELIARAFDLIIRDVDGSLLEVLGDGVAAEPVPRPVQRLQTLMAMRRAALRCRLRRNQKAACPVAAPSFGESVPRAA